MRKTRHRYSHCVPAAIHQFADASALFRRPLLFLVALILFVAQRPAAASISLPIGDELAYWSDINAIVVGKYTYSPLSQSGVLKTTSGRATSFDVGPNGGVVAPLAAISTVKIEPVVISNVGQVTTEGLLTVTLNAAVGGYVPGMLLKGKITTVAFETDLLDQPIPGKLQMLFEVMGGDAMDAFGGLGAIGGIKLDMVGYPGSGASATGFSSSFTFGLGMTGAQADILGAPVPEPGSAWVFGGFTLIAAGALVWKRF